MISSYYSLSIILIVIIELHFYIKNYESIINCVSLEISLRCWIKHYFNFYLVITIKGFKIGEGPDIAAPVTGADV